MKPNNKEYALSFELIKYISFDKYDKDFTFIVNNKEYKTSRFLADLLSPTICNYHMTDPTISTFKINTSEPDNMNNFSEILSLSTFEPRSFDYKQLKYMKEIFLLLGNQTEYSKIDHINEYDSNITKENVLTNLQDKIAFLEHNKRDSTFCEKEIEFISSRFSEFYPEKKEELENLPIEIIEQIFQNEKFQINEEDDLLDFIIEMTIQDDKYSILYDYVEFEKVSEEKLIEFRDNFNINYITRKIFESIIKRVKTSENNKKSVKAKFIEYNENQEFSGIIKYLRNKSGGNPHDKGLMEVTSNSYYSSEHPKNLLDFNDENDFCARDVTNVWILFDFKNRKVKLTNYSIKCYNNGTHQLRSWVIETSNDKQNWNIIDEHDNDETLKCFGGSKTFKTESKEFSQYVRLRQTSEPWDGNDLWFNYIEFYGYLQK